MSMILRATLIIAVMALATPQQACAATNARGNADCTLVSHACVDSAARYIAGQWVSRSCWRWRDTYNCAGAFVNNCQQYINQGCAQISSSCTQYLSSGTCQTYTQQYQCLIQQGSVFDNCASWVAQGCRLTASTTTTQPPNGVTNTNTYNCLDYQGVAYDTCQSLVAQGCSQLSSTCINTTNGVCDTWDKTFSCLTSQGTTTTSQVCANAALCLDGNCFTTNAPPANDFAAVIARFAAVTAAGASASGTGGVSIFTGTPENCNTAIFDAKNCCAGTATGWGTGISSGCPASAKKLAQAREAGQAVFIGTFCANKAFFGACLLKTETWCAFRSRLARIVQQQGRLQLGIAWGAPQNPDCRGFNPTEMQQLDFSRMDLSEFYADIMARMTPMDANALGNSINNHIETYFNNGAATGGRVGP